MVENAPVKVGIIASSAIFNLAFGIAALIVHLQYNDPALAFCGTSTYLTLTQWVEGFGIGNILIFIGTLVFTLLMEKAPVGERASEVWLRLLLTVLQKCLDCGRWWWVSSPLHG